MGVIVQKEHLRTHRRRRKRPHTRLAQRPALALVVCAARLAASARRHRRGASLDIAVAADGVL